MDRGAWWAAVHRVAQSWTRLKRLTMHACLEEGNGNPLQYSCLENHKDRGARWAAVYGVTKSQTRLKRLSSSSSSLSLRKSNQFASGGASSKEPVCQCRRCKSRGCFGCVGLVWCCPAGVFSNQMVLKKWCSRESRGQEAWAYR